MSAAAGAAAAELRAFLVRQVLSLWRAAGGPAVELGEVVVTPARWRLRGRLLVPVVGAVRRSLELIELEAGSFEAQPAELLAFEAALSAAPVHVYGFGCCALVTAPDGSGRKMRRYVERMGPNEHGPELAAVYDAWRKQKPHDAPAESAAVAEPAPQLNLLGEG